MRTAFGAPQFVWLRRLDKVRQGISWWRAFATDQWALRPDQEAEGPAADLEVILRLIRFAGQCEDGGRQWFASTGIRYRQQADRLTERYVGLVHAVTGGLPGLR